MQAVRICFVAITNELYQLGVCSLLVT